MVIASGDAQYTVFHPSEVELADTTNAVLKKVEEVKPSRLIFDSLAELQMLADWIDTRFKDKFVEDHDLIVMGDFNVPKIGDKLFKALTSRGLQVPDSLLDLKAGDVTIGGSNLGKDARYDQILHLPTLKKRFTNFGGTVDFFGSDARIDELFPGKNYTREKFSFQLSDHFPIWVQLDTDIDGERLNQIVQNTKK